MSLAAIENVLKSSMGLNAATIGSSSIAQAVRERMRAHNISDMSSYYARLHTDPGELTELIEAVVVPETWFFRNVKPFEALYRHIADEWLPDNAKRSLRVLTVPCSTGEEPYTIAMVLSDLGLPPERTHILAADISRVNLERAAQGLYTENSFRGDDLNFRSRFFKCQGEHYKINAEIKQRVSFMQGNLLAMDFLINEAPFDIIFCRNLMIYFDRPTQERSIQVLDRLLRSDGVLFVGHAEANLVLNTWENSRRYPHAFAFRKQNDGRREQEAIKPPKQQPKKERRVARLERRRATPPPSKPKPFSEIVQKAPPDKTQSTALGDASKLADQGHLVEAAILCETYLAENGANAQAFYLLGIIREAAGNLQQAEEYLRKTIYLEPKHVEALTQLALLLEEQGDADGASVLHKRIERLAIDPRKPNIKAGL